MLISLLLFSVKNVDLTNLFSMVVNFPFLLTMVLRNCFTFRLLFVVCDCFYNIVAFPDWFVIPKPFTGIMLLSFDLHFTFSIR